MKNNPKISVIMPNYNAEKFLTEAIESVLKQTFTDFEFIIIDDCSTDKSWEIIQNFAKKDKRIIAIRNEKNLKICKTLNKWLEIARWEYIARMDSDDISLPERFAKQLKFLEENKEIGIVGSDIVIIDEKWEKIQEKKYPKIDIKNEIWMRNPFCHPVTLIRKQCFDDFGGYDDEFVYAEDLELWVRFGQKYNFANIWEILLKYRIFGGNSSLQKQTLMIKNTLKVRKNALKLGYKMNIKARIFYAGTWCMQFLPPKFVLWLFNLIMKK